MKKLILALTIALTLTACGTTKDEKTKQLTISAAASLKGVMTDIINVYDKNISLNFANSGDLKMQIQQGAPIDIFISASSNHMDELENGDFLLKGTKKVLFQNSLVLIAPVDKENGITSFNDVATDKVGQIALGDPVNSPAGQYAQELFEDLGIADKIQHKYIYAKDVTQVLTYVERGEVDAGVVYKTDATSNKNVTILDYSDKSAVYPVAVTKDSKNIPQAKDFINFLFSDEAKTIYENYGFELLQ